MTLKYLTAAGMLTSCVQCGKPLPLDRTYEFFCKEACQKAMDAYIVAYMERRPTTLETTVPARSQSPRSSTASPT
jgi:hypothetical protein